MRVDGMPGLEFDLLGLEEQAHEEDVQRAAGLVAEASRQQQREIMGLSSAVRTALASAVIFLIVVLAVQALTPGSALYSLGSQLSSELSSLLAG